MHFILDYKEMFFTLQKLIRILLLLVL